MRKFAVPQSVLISGKPIRYVENYQIVKHGAKKIKQKVAFPVYRGTCASFARWLRADYNRKVNQKL